MSLGLLSTIPPNSSPSEKLKIYTQPGIDYGFALCEAVTLIRFMIMQNIRHDNLYYLIHWLISPTEALYTIVGSLNLMYSNITWQMSDMLDPRHSGSYKLMCLWRYIKHAGCIFCKIRVIMVSLLYIHRINSLFPYIRLNV